MEAKHAELNKKEPESVAQTWVTSSTKTTTPVVSIASSAAVAGAAWTSATSTPKKTLREIQQEEELVMKKKNAKAVKEVQKTVVPVEGWTTVSHVRAPKPTTPVAPAAAAPPV
ncbi:hypothetical protein G6F61_014846 [Rhizopus arrhizus]|nr:hypothetical protein G6F61_014846 [Rhizopus arrhizus]